MSKLKWFVFQTFTVNRDLSTKDLNYILVDLLVACHTSQQRARNMVVDNLQNVEETDSVEIPSEFQKIYYSHDEYSNSETYVEF
jgi:hypothetical protein